MSDAEYTDEPNEGRQPGDEPRRARQTYPEDRFDRVARTGRVGAHRFAARPRNFWQYLLVSVLAFALLTTAGVFWVHSMGGSGIPITEQLRGEEPEPEEAGPAPEIDSEAGIVVLNGTETPNLAAGLEQVIVENEWGEILFTSDAAENDVPISAVFYTDEDDEAAALGLAAELGGLSTYVSTDYEEYGARLVVLIGADYAGPGQEEAERLTAENETGNGAPEGEEPAEPSEPAV